MEMYVLTKDKRQNETCSCELSQELDLATSIQQLLFPQSSPICSWCCIGVKNRMAQGLGGDFFDFIEMRDGCQTLYLGDVTGHGLHASVIMSLIYGFIHHASLDDCNPLATITGINRLLRHFAARSQQYDHLFSTTIFFAIIDPKSLKMHYINCGHINPLIRRENQLIRLESTAPPLGFFEDPEVRQGTFEFRAGDRLLLYTDGLSEAVNSSGEQYGNHRIEAALMDLEDDHMQLLGEIYQRAADFGCVSPPVDDCTAIVLDFHKPLSGVQN